MIYSFAKTFTVVSVLDDSHITSLPLLKHCDLLLENSLSNRLSYLAIANNFSLGSQCSLATVHEHYKQQAY